MSETSLPSGNIDPSDADQQKAAELFTEVMASLFTRMDSFVTEKGGDKWLLLEEAVNDYKRVLMLSQFSGEQGVEYSATLTTFVGGIPVGHVQYYELDDRVLYYGRASEDASEPNRRPIGSTDTEGLLFWVVGLAPLAQDL